MNSPIKRHGGKHYLAKRIAGLIPACRNYVEPYFGTGAVMLARNPEGVSEVANDVDKQLTNFWMVLQDERLFGTFLRHVEATPFSEVEFRHASRAVGWPEVEAAARFFVRVRQSLGGREKQFQPLSTARVRRGMNEQVSAWLTAIDGLKEAHARLKRVAILDRPAAEVIRKYDSADTAFYLDPPYLHVTRQTTGEYAYEMSTRDHADLLDLVNQCKGKVALSSYPNPLYDQALASWNRHEFDLPNNSSSAREKGRETEVVFTNF